MAQGIALRSFCLLGPEGQLDMMPFRLGYDCGYDYDDVDYRRDDRQLAYAFPDALFGGDDDFPSGGGFNHAIRQRATGRDETAYRGADVGHILARQNVHCNRRDNVFMQDRAWNRAAQDNYDELNCAFCGFERCRCAVNAARRDGDMDRAGGLWAGRSAEAIYDQGIAEFSEMGLYCRPQGGFDPRSPALRDGRVRIDASGRPVGVDDCLRDYEARHGRRRHGRPVGRGGY